MLAAIINLAIALVTLGLGAWLTLAGAVLAVHACFARDGDGTARPLTLGVAMAYGGLILFVAGAIGCARLLG